MTEATLSVPRISVILPFLNAERFMGETIESVRAQTYSDWELLAIDDGSTDASSAIAQRYAEEHPGKIRYLAHPQRASRGASAARNLGFAHARGEYLALLDADDLWEPKRLESQVKWMDGRPDVALLGSWYLVIDAGGSILGRVQPPGDPWELRWELFFGNPFATSAVMLRREPVLTDIGGFDPAYPYVQDYDLWCRIAERFAVACLPEYLARYRVHPASLTSTYKESSGEFGRVRTARLAPWLGWAEHDAEDNEARRAAMTALYFGWAVSIEPVRLLRAVDDLLELHTLFAREAGLSREQVADRQVTLRARISANLVMLAGFCLPGGLAVRSRLLARAYQLYPRVFVRPRTMVRVGRAIGGAFLPVRRLAAPTAS